MRLVSSILSGNNGQKGDVQMGRGFLVTLGSQPYLSRNHDLLRTIYVALRKFGAGRRLTEISILNRRSAMRQRILCLKLTSALDLLR